MATLFNKNFEYFEIADSDYGSDGSITTGAVSSRTVRGSVQAINGKELLAMAIGGRQQGSVKVYSDEQLKTRVQGDTTRAYVKCGGRVYELVDEVPNLNAIISHYKYIGSLVPASQVPEALR